MQAEKQLTAISETDIAFYSGKIVARDVSYEDYLSGKYGAHVEWIHGVVIEMSPIHEKHDSLTRILATMFDTYLDLTGGRRVLQEPMGMRCTPELPARQPDVQVLLPDRMDYLQENQVAGPANLVVEVVSPESVKRDRGEKYAEYEQGGVDEYWIIDPQRKDASFFVRGDDDLFHSRLPVEGAYTSHILPRLKISLDSSGRRSPQPSARLCKWSNRCWEATRVYSLALPSS